MSWWQWRWPRNGGADDNNGGLQGKKHSGGVGDE